MAAAGYAHVELGFTVFWDQEAPDDYDDDGFVTRDCVVCGGSTEGTAWCGAGCYQLWKNDTPVDPREEGWGGW